MNITNHLKITYNNKEERNIIYLNEKILKLEIENADLRKKVLESLHFEKELYDAKEHIKKLNKEKYELMEKQNEEIKNYKNEMQKLLNEKDFHQLNYNKRLTIFEQKMGKVNELELENQVYKEELFDLKEKNKKLEEATNNKIKELEINNQLKFKKIKNRVINNLSEAKDNMLKLGLEHFDLQTQLIYLQNNKLLEDIDSHNRGEEKLINEKNKLKLKILDLENQNNANEKIQLHLTSKLYNNSNNISIKEKIDNNSNIDLNLFNKKIKKQHKKYFSLKKNFLINDNKQKFLDSKIFNSKETDINKISFDKKPKTTKNKLKNFNNMESGNTKYKSSNNTLTKMELNTTSKNEKIFDESIMLDKPKINFKHIIDKKNFEIENLNLKIDNLKNRFSFFINKYKKLYEFLEDCLNTFFSELKGESNYKINYEDLIKLNFSKLTKKEKYGVLVLLMNHLMPIITFNFNSNCNLGNYIFTTNINIFDKNFNKTNKHLNDDILKKSFIGKNNKLQKDLFIKSDALFNGTIPVLRKSDNSLFENNKLKNDKFKLVL